MLKASLKGSCLHPLAGKHTLCCFWTVVELDSAYIVLYHGHQVCVLIHAQLTELYRSMSLLMANFA